MSRERRGESERDRFLFFALDAGATVDTHAPSYVRGNRPRHASL